MTATSIFCVIFLSCLSFKQDINVAVGIGHDGSATEHSPGASTVSPQAGPSGISGGGCACGCVLNDAVLQSQRDIISAIQDFRIHSPYQGHIKEYTLIQTPPVDFYEADCPPHTGPTRHLVISSLWHILCVCKESEKPGGWCAVTPLFVKTGSDVTLNVTDVPGNDSGFSWMFNTETVIVRRFPGGKPSIPSPERVEFSLENYSVRLMSLQKADSGVYTAQELGLRQTSALAEYDIRVKDPVSPVEVTVDSVSSGSDSCNLTVSCRTQDAHINSTITCDNETCSQEEGERSVSTSSDASLTIHLVNDSILCNHSNQVSWTNNTMMMKPVCAIDTGEEIPQTSATIAVSVVLTIIVVANIIIIAVLWRRKCGRPTVENTEYASPQEMVTVAVAPSDPASTYSLVQAPAKQSQDERLTNCGSDLSPASTYSVVGPPTRTTQPLETSANKQPESLYAQVERPARPENSSSGTVFLRNHQSTTRSVPSWQE